LDEDIRDNEQNGMDDDLEDLSPDDIEVVGLNEEEEEEEESLRTPTEAELDEIAREAGETPTVEGELAKQLEEQKQKYLRLYADFENYRKRINKDKEDLVRFANENIIHDLLPSLDTLDIALKHVGDSDDNGLAEGVRNTLRELLRTLEKYGVAPIEAEGKHFDPEYHHAVARVERDDMDEGTVVEEMRKGYLYQGKVLRASMVSVSVRPQEAPAE
jgi:molecular chaperone GrpE